MIIVIRSYGFWPAAGAPAARFLIKVRTSLKVRAICYMIINTFELPKVEA